MKVGYLVSEGYGRYYFPRLLLLLILPDIPLLHLCAFVVRI